MRTLLTSGLGWAAVPALILVAIAYMAVVSSILGGRPATAEHPTEELAPAPKPRAA